MAKIQPGVKPDIINITLVFPTLARVTSGAGPLPTSLVVSVL